MKIMNTKRSGIENLFNKVVVPIISDEKEQADCDSHAINVLEQEIATELYKHLKEGPLAVRIMPIVKSNVSYGFNEGEREIRASVQFRKFTFCENCSFFSQDGFNGGYCMKMHDVVHITDGCTVNG